MPNPDAGRAREACALLLAMALGLAMTGCGRGEPVAEPPAPPSGPPTAAELAEATYLGLEAAPAQVTLVDGRWQGPPFVEGGATRPTVVLLRGSRTTGDVDDDGREEALVLLAENAGGSGTLLRLAVMDRREGEIVNTGSRVLGDRVQVRSIDVRDGTIRLEVVRAGPEDPACCPGELATYHWTPGATGIVDARPEEVTGRLSLAVLDGSAWRLERFDRETPAPASPSVTLRYADGRFEGTVACRSYSAAAVDRSGGPAGGVIMSPPTAGSTSCDDRAAELEHRFLRLLGSTVKFSFAGGRLQMHHPSGAMTFEPDATDRNRRHGTTSLGDRPIE